MAATAFKMRFYKKIEKKCVGSQLFSNDHASINRQPKRNKFFFDCHLYPGD